MNIHSVDEEGNNALHHAAKSGALFLLGHLHHHLQIEAVNRFGQTPLHTALLAGQSQVVEFLLEKGANVKTSCPYQTFTITALPLAALRGEVNCVEILIKSKRCDLYEQTSGIGSLLHIAITFHQMTLLNHLFKNYPADMKALLERPNENHLTPFNLAAREGDIEALIILKEQGANPNTKDHEGRGPLHQAVIGHQFEILPWLPHLGCDITQQDFKGKSATSLARELATQNPQDSIAQSIANQLENYALEQGVFQKPFCVVTTYENLVFSSGRAQNSALLGGLKYLQEKNLLKNIQRVAATSTGAIPALLLSIGYTVPEIEEIVLATDLMQFFNPADPTQTIQDVESNSPVVQKLHLACNALKISHPIELVHSLWDTPGIASEESLLHWLEEKILLKQVYQTVLLEN
jgi:ankyrin repeat protein